MTEMIDLIIAADRDPSRACEYIAQMMQHLRDHAPEMWEVSADLDSIIAGKPGRCLVPRELTSLDVGMPLVFDGSVLTMRGQPLSMQAFREALIPVKLPPILFYGPWGRGGHNLCTQTGRHVYGEDMQRLGFPPGDRIGLSKGLDPCYCPGYISQYKRSCPEVEGEAKLTHENGMTVLGIWDRSVDKRGGCHSTYIAMGTYTALTMFKLCELAFAPRWKLLADRVRIKLVEKEAI